MKRIHLLLCALGLSTLMGQAQLANLPLKNGAESADPGTEKNPYVINDLKDLASFRQAVKADGGANVCFELGASIDVSASDWVTMETFKGVLDGKEHNIQGMKLGSVDAPLAKAPKQIGFFRNMDGATVRNLHFTGVAIYADAAATTGHAHYGTLCAGNSSKNPFFVFNCSASGTVVYHNNVPAPAEKPEGNLPSGSLHIGGLIGMMGTGSKVVNCRAEMDLTASAAQIITAGGLVAMMGGSSNAAILNSYFKGSIDVHGAKRTTVWADKSENHRNFVGGICGNLVALKTDGIAGGVLQNCYAEASIKGASDNVNTNSLCVGGIAGGVYESQPINQVLNNLSLCSEISAKQAKADAVRIGRVIGSLPVPNSVMANNYALNSMTLFRNDEIYTVSDKGADQIDGEDIEAGSLPVEASKKLNDYVKANPAYEYKTGSTVDLLTWKAEDNKIVFGDVATSIIEGVSDATSLCFVVDGMVTFEGVDSNAAFQLSGLSGQLLTNGTLKDRSLRLPCKGIYIVRVNGQTYKVAY